MAFAIAFLVLLLIYVEGDNKKRMTEGVFILRFMPERRIDLFL